ncbi:histone H3-K9 methyltransferase [Artemisia annua]|uniref:Histone H3-K9 methyltransferase n=1 Tax=Artemisia annua TaxID=35608 RepID=A0A2U1QEI8_ARTAN|nr:histone H3-K9 methyltransferase [Artemisia annua]
MFPKLEPLDEKPENCQTPNIVPTICLSDDDDDEVANPDALALVLVNPDETQVANLEYPLKRKYQARSGELVRVSNLDVEDEIAFRETVRKTRMIYDSLRICLMLEDEKRRVNVASANVGSPSMRLPKVRNDLRVATIMRDNDLWLNRDKRIVGPIPGVNIGDVFFFRMELCVLGIHGVPQAGIDFLPASMSPNKEPIATSVIVSGGYEDDEDSGDVIVYTGHGGQDKNSKLHVVDQKLEGGNLGMERSMHYGIEVRVIRGFKYRGGVSEKLYVYDGIYKVTDAWLEDGKSGFGVYKFKLVRMEGQPEMGSAMLKFAENIRENPMAARPVGYVSLDISMNKEHVPVFLFNDIDDNNEPVHYEYLARTAFPPFVYQPSGNGDSVGCFCVDVCGLDCACAKKNGGEFGYDKKGILVRGKPLIYECGPHCSCSSECCNRVTQKGVKNRFEVFRSLETGWGVRSLDLIQAGSFLCEYTGVVLTKDQAQVFTMNGEDTLVYPYRFGERWAEWGDLSQVDLSRVYPDYVPPSYFSIPPVEFAMDVSRMRNVACYMSHSPCPNVFVQLVLFDHGNVAFPRLMLFAMEDIPPLRELSLDYGAAGEWTEPLSICN